MLRQLIAVSVIALPPGIELPQTLRVLPTLRLRDESATALSATRSELAAVDQLKLFGLFAVDLVLKFEIGILPLLAGELVAEAGGGVARASEGSGGEVGAAPHTVRSAKRCVWKGREARRRVVRGWGAPRRGVYWDKRSSERGHGSQIAEMSGCVIAP